MPVTLHIHVPLHYFCSLHIEPTLLRISVKRKKKCPMLLPHTCQQEICHIPKLLNVHLWGKNANVYVTYEVAPINDVARIAVHKRCRTPTTNDAGRRRTHSQLLKLRSPNQLKKLCKKYLLCDDQYLTNLKLI